MYLLNKTTYYTFIGVILKLILSLHGSLYIHEYTVLFSFTNYKYKSFQ